MNVASIACPIKGEYIGVLPDAPQFCAKMSSDCNNPNIMFYSVSGCSETSGIYDGKLTFESINFITNSKYETKCFR